MDTEWPKKVTMYVHSEKETNYHTADQLGLSDKATEAFAYTAYELKLDILVSEDGTSMLTHVQGMALKKPVKV